MLQLALRSAVDSSWTLHHQQTHPLIFTKGSMWEPPTAVDFWGQTFFYCATLVRKHETIFHLLQVQIVGSLLWGIGCLFVSWNFKRFDWSKLSGYSREDMIFFAGASRFYLMQIVGIFLRDMGRSSSTQTTSTVEQKSCFNLCCSLYS